VACPRVPGVTEEHDQECLTHGDRPEREQHHGVTDTKRADQSVAVVRSEIHAGVLQHAESGTLVSASSLRPSQGGLGTVVAVGVRAEKSAWLWVDLPWRVLLWSSERRSRTESKTSLSPKTWWWMSSPAVRGTSPRSLRPSTSDCLSQRFPSREPTVRLQRLGEGERWGLCPDDGWYDPACDPHRVTVRGARRSSPRPRLRRLGS
jgi:hypothetical protein